MEAENQSTGKVAQKRINQKKKNQKSFQKKSSLIKYLFLKSYIKFSGDPCISPFILHFAVVLNFFNHRIVKVSSWEDLCRKKLSYRDFLVWRKNPTVWRKNLQNPKKLEKADSLVFQFFIMFDDCYYQRFDDSTRRTLFEWYIFIGCVYAGLTPLNSELIYVVDLS